MSATRTRKKFMFVNRRAPYGTVYALEALEVVLIAAAFEQDVSVAFLDDGVFQLLADQSTRATGMKNFSPTFGALRDFGIEKLYVEQEALEARRVALRDLVVPVTVAPRAALADLMESQDVLIAF